MKAKILLSIFAFCILGSNVSAKPALYPIPLNWDTKPNAQARANYLKMPTLRKDLTEVYHQWLQERCLAYDDYEKCANKRPQPPISAIFDHLSIATPDLNNDGHRDLIIVLWPSTGLSGNGRCGIAEYMFYENVGNDMRNIGQTQFVHADQLYVGAPKAHNKYRDLFSKDISGFCTGEKVPKFRTFSYKYQKSGYFDK